MTTMTITDEKRDALLEVADENNLDMDAFVAFCWNQHINAEDVDASTIREFNASYIGEYATEEEFCEWYADEQGLDIPDLVRPHIEWADVWQCELRHDFYEIDGHYFRAI